MTRLPTARRCTTLVALTLFYCASSLLQAGDVPHAVHHADFGLSPDDFIGGPLEPTSASPASVRERLLQDGILDDAAFASSSSTAPRPPLKLRARQPQVEELPAPSRKAAPQDSGVGRKPAIDESDRHRR